MTGYSRPIGHPAGIISSNGPLRLFGRRTMLRPLAATDFEAWSEVRLRNGEWLTKWEPMPLITSPDPAKSRDAFTHRCAARDRERQSGNAYCMGLFVNNVFAGEVNLNSVMRGAMQSGTIGYWIDEAKAGNSYVSEAVLVLMKFAFEELRLHRMEVCIVPRNANSRRVVEKLQLREEGIAERFLEINGIWEDHVRYGFTIEEWQDRRDELTAAWL